MKLNRGDIVIANLESVSKGSAGMANGVYEKLQRCTDAVREKISFQPEVALILGSGLGDYADEMKIVERIEYSEIERCGERFGF